MANRDYRQDDMQHDYGRGRGRYEQRGRGEDGDWSEERSGGRERWAGRRDEDEAWRSRDDDEPLSGRWEQRGGYAGDRERGGWEHMRGFEGGRGSYEGPRGRYGEQRSWSGGPGASRPTHDRGGEGGRFRGQRGFAGQGRGMSDWESEERQGTYGFGEDPYAEEWSYGERQGGGQGRFGGGRGSGGRGVGGGRSYYGAGQSAATGGGYGGFEESAQYRGYRRGEGGQRGGPADRGFAGRGPKGYQRSDERIREDVCDRLMEDPDLDATEIEIGVKGGEVTLDGTVDSKDAKRSAEDLAEDVSGVREVTNRLRVAREGGETRTQQRGQPQAGQPHGGQGRAEEGATAAGGKKSA